MQHLLESTALVLRRMSGPIGAAVGGGAIMGPIESEPIDGSPTGLEPLPMNPLTGLKGAANGLNSWL
jgi:hypothetical protein